MTSGRTLVGSAPSKAGFSSNSTYTPTVYLIANFPGYSGSSFLDYVVPVTIAT